MRDKIEDIKQDVIKLFAKDNTGHGIDHIMRVYTVAMNLAEKENANKDIVAIAALLHDADDYKIFGQECADKLTNTKAILNKYNILRDIQENIIDIVKNMGYSKSLQGIRPKSLEGKIVSDADMMDAMGAQGIIRTISYRVAKNLVIFDKNIFPETTLSTEEYRDISRASDTGINHFFDKLLKIQGLLFTDAAKEMSQARQDFMISFLYQFFEEQNLDNWSQYLNEFISDIKKVA